MRGCSRVGQSREAVVVMNEGCQKVLAVSCPGAAEEILGDSTMKRSFPSFRITEINVNEKQAAQRVARR
jgi:hypothetical protein